jgi:hypothetical protein
MNMAITAFSKDSSIPKKVLRYLNRQGFIQDPLSPEDRIGLEFLEKVWGKKEILRPQLSRLSKKARLGFIRTADLATRWERYACSRFQNQEAGKKLAMQTVIEEIEITFRFRLTKQQINRLYKIRNRVQVARHREKKSG